MCGTANPDSAEEENNWNGGVETKPATETTAGVKTYTCEVCGETKEEAIDKLTHTHNPSGDWTSDTAGHWHACSGCTERLDYSLHSENGGVVTVQPTSYSTGVRTYSSTICGAVTRTEIIPAFDIPQYIPTAPSYTPPSYSDIVPAPTDDPFVSDNSSARGWEAITTEISANTDGSAVKVDMNGADRLPDTVLETIENQDITVEVRMNNKVSWKINGLDVTDPQTVDLRVSTASRKIPESVMDELGSEKKPITCLLITHKNINYQKNT